MTLIFAYGLELLNGYNYGCSVGLQSLAVKGFGLWTEKVRPSCSLTCESLKGQVSGGSVNVHMISMLAVGV